MGEAERFEQRTVHRQHRAVGDREREAHLPFEGQGIDVCLDDGHAYTIRLLVSALTNSVLDITHC